MSKDCCSHEEEYEEVVKGLDIKSRRTAEHPEATSSSHDHFHSNDGHSHGDSDSGIKQYIPTALSLFLLLSGIALEQVEASFFNEYIRFFWFAVAYLLVGAKVLKQAWFNIKRGDVFNEFFLMSLATLGAFYIGEYAEGVAVMLFYLIGEHFQEAAVMRSRRSIKALIDNRPESVTLIYDGKTSLIHPDKVKIGETILIKAGEKVALDGDLLSEKGSFNTSALTGESKPHSKAKGEKILAGMINLERAIELNVSNLYHDSSLAKILKLVERATSRKAKTQQFITRFAKVYTPIVVFLSLAIITLPYLFVDDYGFNEWLYRGLIFLVISCPCALVISIPLGYFGGIGAASRNGILFKGSNFLDLITKVDTVVMDKTGTLTKGVFKVQKVESVGIDQKTLIDLTAALESRSTHPIAKAIMEYAGNDFKSLKTEDVEEIAGHGLKGVVDGNKIIAGNSRLLQKFNIDYDGAVDEHAESIVFVAINEVYAGYFLISDEIKEDALRTVKDLYSIGIQDFLMLSGDRQAIVDEVSTKLSIPKAFGELLPEDKVNKVEELKRLNKTVAFVGDGINDAPVITVADVGVAMGGLGSDAAIETADVVIQNDQPSKLVTAIRIGKATKQIVWQNIGLSFGVKLIVLALGAGGLATMWEAVFADVGVAFLAILNAIRIQRMKF